MHLASPGKHVQCVSDNGKSCSWTQTITWITLAFLWMINIYVPLSPRAFWGQSHPENAWNDQKMCSATQKKKKERINIKHHLFAECRLKQNNRKWKLIERLRPDKILQVIKYYWVHESSVASYFLQIWKTTKNKCWFCVFSPLRRETPAVSQHTDVPACLLF